LGVRHAVRVPRLQAASWVRRRVALTAWSRFGALCERPPVPGGGQATVRKVRAGAVAD